MIAGWLRTLFCLLLITPVYAQDSAIHDDMLPESRLLLTHHQLTGNRYIGGTGTFLEVTLTEYHLPAVPAWIIGTPERWYVEADGLYEIADGAITQSPATRTGIPALIDGANILRATDASLLTHPVPAPDTGLYLDITTSGDLVLLDDGSELDRIPLNLQPDARIVISHDGRIAVYANATDQRYVHGIMGDDLEGVSLVVLHIIDRQLAIIEQVDLTGDAVYEGLSPIWADVNDDGVQDLITTVSDSRTGSRIRAYLFAESATLAVDGPAIGHPNRWQHQLAWGPFSSDGTMQLVDVRTPHIGGIVRFYEFTGTALEIVAELRGYTSHIIGSRNLDMAVAGDFDGDGQPEIVLPSQDRTRIAGIVNRDGVATVAWELPLGSRLTTNLAAALSAQGLVLAAGLEDGTIKVWAP